MIACREAALRLDRQVEVLDPIVPRLDGAARRGDSQGEAPQDIHAQAVASDADVRRKRVGPGLAVMIAAVGQEIDPQPPAVRWDRVLYAVGAKRAIARIRVSIMTSPPWPSSATTMSSLAGQALWSFQAVSSGELTSNRP